MNDWLWGYLMGKRKQQRRNARELAGVRYQMEQDIRARNGLPLLPPSPLMQPLTPGRPWVSGGDGRGWVRLSGRLARRAAVVAVVVVALLVLAFAALCVAYGLDHHLIYWAHPRALRGVR